MSNINFEKTEIEWYLSQLIKFRISNDFNKEDVISIRQKIF